MFPNMFCCLKSKKKRYSPENNRNSTNGDKKLRNGSTVSISVPIPKEDNPEDHVYANSSIEELTKLCAKQSGDNNNYQENPACTDLDESEIPSEEVVDAGLTITCEPDTEESLTTELENAQREVSDLLARADTMSEENLMNAVSRLENVAARLENLARSQPASRSSSSTGDAESSAAFVTAFDGLLNGTFAKFISLSASIGGEVKTQSDIVQEAFRAQRQFLVTVSQSKQPPQTVMQDLLSPTSEKITAIQEYRENNRKSALFNHLSAINDSIPSLGWVAVSPTPAPYVSDMIETAQFYTNRVMKDYKEKDQQHVEWAKVWISTLKELQAYIKEYHTTGVSWNPKGGDAKAASAPASGARAPPPPPPGVPPPPPPPPPADLSAAPAAGGEAGRAQLFAELNQGTEITKGLKRVTDDMKTHKNPALRQGPAPFKAVGPPKPAPKPEAKVAPAAVKKPPVTELQGKKWIVEYHSNNNNVVLDDVDPKQVVYVYKCTNSTVQIKGKVNSILVDGCKKTAIAFEDVVSSIEFVNCQSVKGQVMGKVSTVSIDKTDGCMMYLSKASVSAEIISAKSSEMNILVPTDDGDFKEFPLPEQFRSSWNGSKFVTTATESL